MSTNNKILGLDGIRGLAALTVVLTHLGVYDYLLRAGLMSRSVLPMIHGGAGVHIFFVLSGFLITTLLIKEAQATGSISLRNFYIRRALRIFPLYFLVVILVGIIEYFGNAGVSQKSFIYAITYIYNFIPRKDYSAVIGHTWSLAVEEHYYLLWPALFTLTFLSRRMVLYVVAVLFIALSIYLASGVLAGLNKQYFIDRWTMVAGGSIMIGSVGALLVNAGNQADLCRRVFASMPALALSVFLYVHTLVLAERGYSTGLRAIGIGLFILWLYLNQRGVLARVLEWRPLRYLGTISYGIYMWQGFFLSTGPWRASGVIWPPNSTTGLLLLIIVAPLSYHFFEKPILRIKDKYSAVRSRDGETAPAAASA